MTWSVSKWFAKSMNKQSMCVCVFVILLKGEVAHPMTKNRVFEILVQANNNQSCNFLFCVGSVPLLIVCHFLLI